MSRPWIVLLGLLALAVNLRAALAGYPPLLETVRAELGTSAGLAGAVQAGAVLMMAAGSFAGAAIGARSGRETALGLSVGLVALGSAVRGVAALPALVAGSVLVGFGIGVAGVLLTAVVKERLPEHVGAVTGAYVVSMLVGATAASAVAVPLAVGLGGWSWSLAVWAVPATLAAAAWLAVVRAAPDRAPESRSPSPWREPLARLAALYLAGASLMVYGWMTWLSPLYESRGWRPQDAGLLLAAWSIAQIPAALLVPALAQRSGRWALWSGGTLACGVAGTLGVLLVPEPPLLGPWLWVALIGVGAGAGFPLGLTIIAWRTPDGAASAAVSGLALGVGYTVAGIGPLVMGLLVDVTGGYPAALAVLLVAGAAQAAAILRLSRGPATADRAPDASAARSTGTALRR